MTTAPGSPILSSQRRNKQGPPSDNQDNYAQICSDNQAPERPHKKELQIPLDCPLPTSTPGVPSDHDQQHSPKTIRPHTKNHSHNWEHGSPSTMPVEPLHRVNRSIHKLKKSFLTNRGA